MKNQILKKIYRAVVYLRLSDEDGDNRESDSISNQRILIHSFLKSHPEIQVVKECVDDGYTGTNFNRPGFQEMLRMLEEGEADCIIVKDLSRYGRDFSGVLQYVERILPKMGVRLILVNDNYDSLTPNRDFLTLRFKSLINDLYPADTSKSVRSHLYVKMTAGQCVAPFAFYGYLKSEKGVHRLVRISPFNAAGKRQTSFVSCDVMPDIKKDLDVEINDDDIRIDTYRSSGAGGQHINKTSSAIRITHFPTGIVVQCQNERSQHMNKDKAMQMLKAKLFLLKQQEAEAKLSGIRGEVTDIGWGNQIRSYVMQPYTMVKDHRTSEETGNVDAVLDGEIDPFINAYLKWIALSKKTAEQ